MPQHETVVFRRYPEVSRQIRLYRRFLLIFSIGFFGFLVSSVMLIASNDYKGAMIPALFAVVIGPFALHALSRYIRERRILATRHTSKPLS